jgi:hypothetical protein
MVLQGSQVLSLAAGALPSTERGCAAAMVGAAETGARTARRRIALRARWGRQRQIRISDLLPVARLRTDRTHHTGMLARE